MILLCRISPCRIPINLFRCWPQQVAALVSPHRVQGSNCHSTKTARPSNVAASMIPLKYAHRDFKRASIHDLVLLNHDVSSHQ
jgi:hypothetical protein